MSTAKQVAESLTRLFLEQGRFDELGPTSAADILPASAQQVTLASDVKQGFAGLSVRTVGYADKRGPIDPIEGGGPPTCFVYVTRISKRAEAEVPGEVEGVAVRVKKVGRIFVKPEAASASTNQGKQFTRKSRITCGSSIGPASESIAGTMGALLADAAGEVYCLSNNHVIGGCNHYPEGTQLVSPAMVDVRPNGPSILQLANLSQLEELRSGHVRYVQAQRVDAAIGKIVDPSKVTSWQAQHFDTPATTRSPQIGETVQKVGRSTGLTTGIVESHVPTLLPLPYKAKRFSATVNFCKVWTISAIGDSEFALPGDSGALVVSEDAGSAVGLLFACTSDGSRAWVADIQDVLAKFKGMRLLAGH